MAIEKARGCGYRMVGGMYLIGGVLTRSCDRLPINLEVCPVCGGGIKVGKGFTEVNPVKLWDNHHPCSDHLICYVCYPTAELGFIMRVGEKFYSPVSFINEAREMGVSKRIPFIPRKLVVGKTPIYLVHKSAGWKYTDKEGKRLLEEADAIFTAFIPNRIEQLVWSKDLKGEKGDKLRADLEKRGITVVEVPDGDRDHDPRFRKKKVSQMLKERKKGVKNDRGRD